jgi:hypothetical protein
MLRFAWVLPIASAVFSVSVISFCVALAKASGHIPVKMLTPPISLAGIHAPEYMYFAVGFVIMAIAITACEELFWRAAVPWMPPLNSAKVMALGLPTARVVLRLALFGLALVGVVPLQGWGSLATVVHLGGSMAFFMGSLHHGFAITQAFASPCLKAHPLSATSSPMLWWAKNVALYSGLLSFFPSEILKYFAQVRDDELEGFAQWWMVGSLICYFTLFAADLRILQALPAPAPTSAVGGYSAVSDGAAAAAVSAHLERHNTEPVVRPAANPSH